jgi:MTH538 TIR-like domain (DUF1863)
MTAKRVYFAFDYDADLDVKQGIVAQSKRENCPFDFEDNSIPRAVTESWTAEARSRIAASDCVIVLCGEQTHQSKGVETELQIAQELGKRYFLLRATRRGTPTPPPNARATDKIWSSRWPTVKILLEGGTPPDDAGQ